MKSHLKFFSAFILFSMLLVCCKKEEMAAPVSLPQITTTFVSNIQQTTATSGGTITNDGGGKVSARGVCWSTTESPTILSSLSSDLATNGVFTSYLTDLIPNTTYYLRAYATNSAGTAYGQQTSFTTTTGLPTLTTLPVTNIFNGDAESGGIMTSVGTSPISIKGIVYATHPNPTQNDSGCTDNPGPGNFTCYIKYFGANVTYYVRAFAVNDIGTAYGNEVTFVTPNIPALPVVTLESLNTQDIAVGSIKSISNLVANGTSNVTEVGICWVEGFGVPTINDHKQAGPMYPSAGLFYNEINTITPYTHYGIRAYATNGAGTSYSETRYFNSYGAQVGDPFQGGVIVYLSADGHHGLIGATVDQSTSANWGCAGTDIPGAENGHLLEGQINTTNIVQTCSENSGARICNDLVLNGYDDWYLPNLLEMQYLANSGILGYEWHAFYMTSTQNGASYFYAYYFGTFGWDQESYHFKSDPIRVRAVRTF